MLLDDPKIYPDDKVLRKALGKSFSAYSNLMEKLAGPDYSFLHEWRYYNDGKSWLCKVTYKKKTVFWLSAWEGHFRASFYFTERSGSGIASLDIPKEIRNAFAKAKPFGKLIPLRFVIDKPDQLEDFMKVVNYKIHNR